MKRIIVGILVLSSIFQVKAQEAADKKVQAGLVFGYGMAFQKMGTKLMKSNGIGSDLTIGANVNYSFNENIGLNLGIEFDFETLKYKAGDNPVYYRYFDSEIQQNEAYTSESQLFQLTERKQKPIYLTLPTMVMFRTKFIGYFRYYGKFGLKTSFLLGNKITDEGFNFTNDGNPLVQPDEAVYGENTDMKTKNEMLFLKSSVGLAGGAEWNFVGSTCLALEIGYYYGFVPLYNNKKNEDSFLFVTDATGANESHFSNNAKQSQLMFKLSILF